MSNINDHYDGVYIRPYNYHDVQYLYCLDDTMFKTKSIFCVDGFASFASYDGYRFWC